MSWWRRLRHRDRLEGELDRELRDHVDRQVADHLRAGLPEKEARRRARLEFGGLDQIKELCRDAGGARWLDDLGRDLRYALRRQFTGRGSGVSVFAVAALALGVGAGTAMFSVLDAVVLQPLPFPQEDRLVVGWKTSRTDPARFIELSYPEFLAWQAQSTSFDSLAALPTTVYGYSYVLTGRGDPVTIESARVTGEFFDALAVRPLLGRTFRAADDREGAPPTVVLTHAFWTNVLGADPGVVGAGLTLTGVDFTVIGVLPAGFVFPLGCGRLHGAGHAARTVEQPHRVPAGGRAPAPGRVAGAGGLRARRHRIEAGDPTAGGAHRGSGRGADAAA